MKNTLKKLEIVENTKHIVMFFEKSYLKCFSVLLFCKMLLRFLKCLLFLSFQMSWVFLRFDCCACSFIAFPVPLLSSVLLLWFLIVVWLMSFFKILLCFSTSGATILFYDPAGNHHLQTPHCLLLIPMAVFYIVTYHPPTPPVSERSTFITFVQWYE